MRKRRWQLAGVVYFCALFAGIPAVASAYIDPSITSYAIQAIAGIVIASGAFFAAYGRRAKKGWMKALGVEVLCLTPVFESDSNHRYNASDYLKIDPMLGTEAIF